MSKFYIHNTGYFLTRKIFPNGILPYIMSTESSFCHQMLNVYFTNLREPSTLRRQYFTQHLMENYAYYLHTSSPVPIDGLFYIKNRATEYSINITNYQYLLN